MPPPLPTRYELEVRIGRDGDVEEWLANDAQLDRPVLVRFLGPESSPARRARFIDHTRAAAGVAHQHVASVYEVGTSDDGAWSVSEWPGGIRLSDRERSGIGVDPASFLPNAEGLARALAALHSAGTVHGALDAGAVFFSDARPAKLAAFGRTPSTTSPDADVRALAAVLEEALTGRPAGSVPPSEVIDGLSGDLDAVFEAARQQGLTADGLAERFAAVPAPTIGTPPVGPGRRSWWMAGALLVTAAVLVVIGTQLAPEPVVVPGATPSTAPDGSGIRIVEVASFDPLGDGGETDRLLGNLTDDDPGTSWATESYFDPLPLLKAGVGVTFAVEGSPSMLRIEAMSRGTVATLHWRETSSPNLAEWEALQRIEAGSEVIDLALPPRTDGVWLLWITDLPAEGQVFRATIGEVSFR